MRIGITGPPGVGKTTLVMEVVKTVRTMYDICGFVTQEVREGGVRVGFYVVDLATGAKAPLARIGAGEPSVGKYVVITSTCSLIYSAMRPCDLLVVDEIGAMEFKCREFEKLLKSAVSHSPKVLATVHRNYQQLARSLGLEIIWLERSRWDEVFHYVLGKLGLRAK